MPRVGRRRLEPLPADAAACRENALRTAVFLTPEVSGRAAPSPAPPSAFQPPARPARTRLEVGLAYAQGVHHGTFKVGDGSLKLDSVLGGSGVTESVGVWRDGVFGRWWSVGVEYLHLQNEARAKVSLPHGVSVLTDPVNGAAKVWAHANAVYFDLAYRPRWTADVEGVVGGGLGVGYGSVYSEGEAESAFTGTYALAQSSGSIGGGIQAFAGVAFDLASAVYVEPLLRANLFAWPQHQYVDLSVGSTLGLRF